MKQPSLSSLYLSSTELSTSLLRSINASLTRIKAYESDNRSYWLARNHIIIDWLLYERSSIICLQEFWVGNEELVNMYEKRLGDAGYLSYKLGRTNNRGDGKQMVQKHTVYGIVEQEDGKPGTTWRLQGSLWRFRTRSSRGEQRRN